MIPFVSADLRKHYISRYSGGGTKFPQLTLVPGREVLLKQRKTNLDFSHFDVGSLDFISRNVQPGETVEIRAFGKLLGHGWWEPELKKVVAFDYFSSVRGSTGQLPLVDHDFWKRRVEQAMETRYAMLGSTSGGIPGVSPLRRDPGMRFHATISTGAGGGTGSSSSAYRMINGASDGLPGLIVDRLGESWTRIQVRSRGATSLLPVVYHAIREHSSFGAAGKNLEFAVHTPVEAGYLPDASSAAGYTSMSQYLRRQSEEREAMQMGGKGRQEGEHSRGREEVKVLEVPQNYHFAATSTPSLTTLGGRPGSEGTFLESGIRYPVDLRSEILFPVQRHSGLKLQGRAIRSVLRAPGMCTHKAVLDISGGANQGSTVICALKSGARRVLSVVGSEAEASVVEETLRQNPPAGGRKYAHESRVVPQWEANPSFLSALSASPTTSSIAALRKPATFVSPLDASEGFGMAVVEGPVFGQLESEADWRHVLRSLVLPHLESDTPGGGMLLLLHTPGEDRDSQRLRPPRLASLLHEALDDLCRGVNAAGINLSVAQHDRLSRMRLSVIKTFEEAAGDYPPALNGGSSEVPPICGILVRCFE